MTESEPAPERHAEGEPDPVTDTDEPIETFSDANTFGARHAHLAAGYGGREDPADPADVLAMPIVLNIPKIDPPARSNLLAAAAIATVRLCLDPRVGPEGRWSADFVDWTDARIRKVARRARGAQWTAAQDVDGVTVDVAGAQARAFVPGRVGELDPRIKRLQIGGTDIDHDRPEPPPAGPVFWIDGSLNMTVGKAAAQVGHAAMMLAGAMSEERCRRWSEDGFACAVRDADAVQWGHLVGEVRHGRAVAVRDAGFTEVAPGSTTVIGIV